jgi:hypothetical protein
VKEKEHARNHHYVPRWYLKNFSRDPGKKSRIYVYDKYEDRIFHATPASVASEIGFYDYPNAAGGEEVEAAFQQIEAPTATIVRRIILEKSLRTLQENERAMLALFVAVQILRVKEHREQFTIIDGLLRSALAVDGATPEELGLTMMNPEDVRMGSIQNLRAAREFLPHLLDKDWILLQSPGYSAYYTSDNPVTQHNTINQDPHMGTTGIASRGVEIYLPLTAHLCLAMFCATIKEVMPQRVFVEALSTGSCVKLSAPNIVHGNSLQVAGSTRFLFSSKPDFILAKQMIKDNPAFRKGRKLEGA